MATLNGIPVYKITFKTGGNKGIDKLSLVDEPAIQEAFIAMSKTKTDKIFLNEDKQLLYGPFLIPDQLILRKDEQGKPYYISFSKEVIQDLVRDIQLNGRSVNLNYQHIEGTKVDGVIQEIWLTGLPDKSNSMGFNLPEGTAFGGVYISDKEFWMKEVKTGNVKGFSIEAFLDMELKKIKMEATTKDGIVIKTDAEGFKAGVEVYSEKDGVKTKIEDCSYDLGNGTLIEVKDSKITEVKELSPEEAEEYQLRELLAPIVKSYDAKLSALETKITELETKLENAPAIALKKHENKKEETAYDRVVRLKKLIKDSKN